MLEYASAALQPSTPSDSPRNKLNGGFSLKHSLEKKTAIVLFCAIAVVWLALDRASKAICDGFPVGHVICDNVLGLFKIKLAHNTGAAWSMFSDSTFALGVFSLLVCAGLLAYLFAYRKASVNVLEAVGLSLVFAGGLGNAFDRFAYGYVVDFIKATFVDFPIFNVADISVTCGVVIFIIGTIFYMNESE